MTALLAVDVGVRTGLACWGDDAHLRWYRSHNLGNAARLRRAIPGLLDAVPDLAHLVLEGGGPLVDTWRSAGEKRALDVTVVSAETWRALFLLPREQRDGSTAKQVAGRLARRAITWGGARQPTSLTHDAAEAVLVGLWGLLAAGWLREAPAELFR